MRSFRKSLLITFGLSAITLPACKTKKALPKPPQQAAVPTLDTTVKKVILPIGPIKAPTTDVAASATPATQMVPKANYNFANVQFEFDSAVLKTASYPMLDKVALEMKKDPSVTFNLNGYSSAEGTVEHNQALSNQRAGAVKSYLMNAGIDESRLSAKGYGESNPIAHNTTDEGKAQNRRVEIKKN
jgi:OOP family OmpA-OmpF porin